MRLLEYLSFEQVNNQIRKTSKNPEDLKKRIASLRLPNVLKSHLQDNLQKYRKIETINNFNEALLISLKYKNDDDFKISEYDEKEISTRINNITQMNRNLKNFQYLNSQIICNIHYLNSLVDNDIDIAAELFHSMTSLLDKFSEEIEIKLNRYNHTISYKTSKNTYIYTTNMEPGREKIYNHTIKEDSLPTIKTYRSSRNPEDIEKTEFYFENKGVRVCLAIITKPNYKTANISIGKESYLYIHKIDPKPDIAIENACASFNLKCKFYDYREIGKDKSHDAPQI